MKALRFLVQTVFLCAAVVSSTAQATNTTTILGQWDFDTNDLAIATVGVPLHLSFVGATQAPQYETRQVGTNLRSGVMYFPATTPTDKILATFTNVANGDGTNLNQYTIIMDLMWPSTSDGTFRGVFNTDTNNTDDAEIYLDPDNRIGIFNNYTLQMDPGAWYRLALVYDLTTNGMTRYLNGTNISSQILEGGEVDGRFSLRGGVLFFADNDFETAPGYVNVIQLRAGAMTEEQIAALGGPASGGLGQGTGSAVPEPSNVRIESIVRQGNTVVITVSGANGANIRIERTNALVNPTWSTAAGPSANPSFTVAVDRATAFFRAVAVP